MTEVPAGPPSIFEDAGTLLASLRERWRVGWWIVVAGLVAIGAAGLLTEWAWQISGPFVVSGLTLLLRIPWCPRRCLRGVAAPIVTVVACVVAMRVLTLGARPLASTPQALLANEVFRMLFHASLVAAALLCAAAARTSRRGMGASDAEAATVRLVARLDAHPWATAVVAVASTCPVAFGLAVAQLEVHRASASLFAASPLQAWKLLPGAAGGGLDVWLAVATVSLTRGRTAGDAWRVAVACCAHSLAGLGAALVSTAGLRPPASLDVWIAKSSAVSFGAQLLTVAAAYLGCRLAATRRETRAGDLGAAIAGLIALGVLLTLGPQGFPGPSPDDLLPVSRTIATQISTVLWLATILLAASTDLPLRRMVLAGLAAGSAISIIAGIVGGAPWSGLFSAPVVALRLAWFAVVAAAVRRILASTPVPRHHVLVRDWARSETGVRADS